MYIHKSAPRTASRPASRVCPTARSVPVKIKGQYTYSGQPYIDIGMYSYLYINIYILIVIIYIYVCVCV